MNTQEKDVWLGECKKFRVDPDEIEIVAARYDSYRKYTQSAEGEVLPIENWFHWYHVERASESQNLGAAPDGCSVDNQSLGNSLIRQPGVFLKLLAARVTHS